MKRQKRKIFITMRNLRESKDCCRYVFIQKKDIFLYTALSTLQLSKETDWRFSKVTASMS